MSQSVTLKTSGAKVLKEGTNAKGKWRLFGILDEYGEVFGTWFNDASMAREIADCGGEIEVEFEEDGDRRTIKSVGTPVEASSNGNSPAEAEARVHYGSLPETAWLCAAQMAKSDLGFDAAKNLADKILVDLKLKNGIDDPENYPF